MKPSPFSKSGSSLRVLRQLVLPSWLLLAPCGAFAQDAGDDGGAACLDDAGSACDGGAPLACDGGLCDTTNGAGCSLAPKPTGLSWVLIAIAALAGVLARRWFSRGTTGACIILALTVSASSAFAEPPPAVDVAIREEPPPPRFLTIEYNPLQLIIGKFSASIVVAPIDHHALVLSPFYFSTETAPIFVFDEAGTPTQLPKQRFEGFGGELGYRYYFGERGPRGFFLGPSGILSTVKATAQNGSQTHFRTYGGAVDIGYQMLVADRVSLSLGAGAQYTKTSQSIPNQQFPSNFNVNGGVRPRLLVSLGFAF